jgi:hypothetical protein
MPSKRQPFRPERGDGLTASLEASLLFGFGTDGQGTLPWLAQNLAAVFTILLSIVLITALAALLYAIARELRRHTIFLDPIDVPRALDARGYSPVVVAERLLDALSAMQHRAPTLKELRGVESGAAPVDLQVPGRFSLQAMVRYIRRLLRTPEPHIGGEITCEGESYELTLRRRDQSNVAIVGVHRGEEIGSLLAAAAEDVLRRKAAESLLCSRRRWPRWSTCCSIPPQPRGPGPLTYKASA